MTQIFKIKYDLCSGLIIFNPKNLRHLRSFFFNPWQSAQIRLIRVPISAPLSIDTI